MKLKPKYLIFIKKKERNFNQNVKRFMQIIKFCEVSSSKSLSYGFWCDADNPKIYHTTSMIAYTKGCTKVIS